MYTNAKSPKIDYGNSSQLTNWTLDSNVTCHMTPDIYYFIPGLLVETDKYIEVAYENYVTAK